MNNQFKNKIIIFSISLFISLMAAGFRYMEGLFAHENIQNCYLDYPLDKSILVNNDPLLVVKKTSYNNAPELLHIQLSFDRDFFDPVIDESVRKTWQYQVKPQLLKYGQKYFWRARTKFTGKVWSKWSNIFGFRIDYPDHYKRQRGFTEQEIATLKSSGKLKQILKGYFPEDMSLSWDGKWITFYEHTRDISNNKIYLMPTNGSHLRLIPAPYGYKSFPRLLGDFLYINYRPPTGVKTGKGIRRRGIYRFNLKKPYKGWVFIAKSYIKYLKTNQPWSFNLFKQNRQININMFYKFSSNNQYPVFVDLEGRYRKIILDSKKENLFAFIILNKKLSKYDTDFAVYHSKNFKNSLSTLLLPGVIDPSIGLAHGVENILLYTKIKPQTRHIYAYNLDNGKNYIAVKSTGNLYCNQPVFNPVNNKFYFHAQSGTDAYGIFETTFNTNMDLQVQSKRDKVLEKIDYYLNNNYNWKKAFLHLATNQHLFDKATYFRIRAKIDKIEQKTKKMQQDYKTDLDRPVDSVKPEMISVKGGTYYFQNKDIKINDFYIGKYEVTNKDVVFIYNWAIKHKFVHIKKRCLFFREKKILDVSTRYVHLYLKLDKDKFTVSDKYKNQPVIQVTWKEAAFICNLFSYFHGYAPFYDIVHLKYKSVKNEGYRLPTEVEWEFAARGGNKSNNFIYAGGNNPDKIAWYAGNFYGKQPSVGLRLSNELGLYDMSGNVWEWCDSLKGGNSDENISRVQPIRGGAWTSEKENMTLPARNLYKISGFSHDLGFRMVRTAD